MSPQPGVTVATLLGSRPEAFGLPLELMAGGEGLDRVITSPHIQKTGLALAGFHEYLKPGRILIFGESEIRYLESLDAAAREHALRLSLTIDFPCVMITGGFVPPPELVAESERARGCRCCGPRSSRRRRSPSCRRCSRTRSPSAPCCTRC